MNKETYQQKYSSDDAVGWMAIDAALEKIYGATEPKHYGPLCGVHFMAGGTDPIDGASIYEATTQEPHKHLVSYGMSQLYYNEEVLDEEFSKWGFEFTMRLKPFEGDQDEPTWIIQVMNNLARYVYKSGKWFEENHFIPANGPIRLNTDTKIVGFVLAKDPELGTITTDHGELTFLQLVGITEEEVALLQLNPTTTEVAKLIAELKKDNPLLITDLYRK